MKKFLALSVFFLISGCISFAQVKSSYQYSTTMPYGTLDIRTKISSTNYYYLQEDKTFSFRESAPGVRTNAYLDMTSYESSPYKQGNLRQKNGSLDKFIMNYRMLMPNGYNSSYAEGYPLILIFHGAVERANCYYKNCYHATPSYTVDANSPAAPKTATHKLLNNDHHLNVGGKQHMDARNLAGTRLPNDPTMPGRAFPGFVLMPQMFNIWDSLQVQDVVRLVRLMTSKYKIDQNRIYVEGYSIGGYAVYEAMKRASWLFAAALPMGAVWDANIFTQNLQNKVAHLPFWTFQGGKDTRPTPAYTENIISKLTAAGAVVRYSLYADLGHVVWNRAFGQSDFYKWMLSKNKSNIHPFKGNTVINKSQGISSIKLMLAEGFLAYQWEKNGVVISTAKSPTYTATVAGTYRARFSRLSSAPTTTQWNRWSDAVKITQVTTTAMVAQSTQPSAIKVETETEGEEAFAYSVYPNPATTSNVNLHVRGAGEERVQISLTDQMGKEVFTETFEGAEFGEDKQLTLPASVPGGVYILRIRQGQRLVRTKVVLQN
ncbi:MAG: prolyl oligopeptidase family serine peptidase [Cyclobacteriaceae bacterium]